MTTEYKICMVKLYPQNCRSVSTDVQAANDNVYKTKYVASVCGKLLVAKVNK